MPNATSWSHLETPVALLDAARLQANVERMQTAVGRLGAALRPHVKTAKCVEVARLHQRAGARGITVSTLKEAEVFFDAGFDDILYAVGIAPSKLGHARALRERGCRLKIVVDSVEAAQAVVAEGHPFEVLIEVDTDGERAGVRPESDLLVDVGRVLHAGGAALAGVMTHAGGSYHLHEPQALADFAEQERALTVRAAQRLRAAGLPCPVVSVGSTPTALSARRLDGVTEVRAGVYVFHDLVMAGLGVCRLDEIALSVGASVIGHQVDKGWTLIDAGWMALSRDRGTAGQAVDQGYGLVCAEDGAVLGDHVVSITNQEHGIVTRRDGTPEPDVRRRFPIGSRLRILPNHACATAAQFDRYHVIGAGGALQTWPRFGGW